MASTARTRDALEAESENLRLTADAALNSVEAMSTKLTGQIDMLKTVSTDANDVGEQMQVRRDEQSKALRQAGHDLSAHAGELQQAIQDQASHLSTLQTSVDGYGSAISEEFEKKIEKLIRQNYCCVKCTYHRHDIVHGDRHGTHCRGADCTGGINDEPEWTNVEPQVSAFTFEERAKAYFEGFTL